MKRYLFIFLCFLNFIFTVTASEPPQRCEELSVHISDFDLNIDFYLILKSEQNGNKNLITIKNYTEIMKPFGTPLPTPNPDYNNPFYKFSINDLYLKNLTIPYNFNIDDGSLNLNVQWDPYNWYGSYEYKVNWGFFITNANFIFYDGRMFDQENKCLIFNEFNNEFFVNDDRFISNTNITTCCTSFKPIPVAPTKFPKCTNFKISSKIYYTANNSFLVTTNANFVLTDNSFISAKGEYGQTYEPEQIQESWLYAVNNFACQKSFGFSQYCYYSLNEKDKTLFIQIYPASEDTKFLFLAGQIILRDNQTLISDGIPFSTSTMCTNFTRISKIYNDDGEYSIAVVSELCCNSFETPTPPPPTPQKPVAKIGQKCTSLTTKYIDSRNTTISARLEISSFNSTNNILKIEILHISTPINYEYSEIWFNAFGDTVGTGDENATSAVWIYGDTPYYIAILLGSRSRNIIISGIIDNGSFIAFDGQLFDQNDHKCFDSSPDLTTIFSNIAACCESFEEIEVSNTYKSHPRCEKFHVTSNFYNSTDDTLFVTSSADFLLTETDITGVGEFSIRNSSEKSVTVFYINGFEFEISLNGTQFGGYPINGKNSEILLHVGYYNGNYGVLTGRIIILDGQTLMEQGLPYTASNKCASYSSSYYNSLAEDPKNTEGEIYVVSEICCTQFLSSTDTTPSTLSSQNTMSTSPGFTVATTPGSCHDTDVGCQNSIDKCKNSLYKPFMCKYCRLTCNLCNDPQCSTFV